MTLNRPLGALFVLALVAACGAEESESTPTDDGILAPPAAGQGVQFKMLTTIEPGTEVEHCQFVKAPPEGMNVNRDQVKFTSGSHHVLLYQTPYTEIPTESQRGGKIDTSGVFDCSNGATFDWQVTTIVAGSQNISGASGVEFPPDVAMKVPGNAVLLINAHYINTSAEPIEPEVAINVYTIPDSQVKIEGGLLFWYNPFIRVDANGGGLAKMSCPIPEDIMLGTMQSHMHRRGVDYAATVLKDGVAGETLYENQDWEGVPVTQWKEGHKIEGGSRIEYFCGYKNAEARDVYQGPRTTDEMCMLIGSYWPARPEVSLCALDPKNLPGTQDLAAEWTGNGTATCGETLSCIQNASQDTFDAFFQDLTDCVDESRPASKKTVSDGVRCLLTREDPEKECAPEITACLTEDP
jgi:hypothetical protein